MSDHPPLARHAPVQHAIRRTLDYVALGTGTVGVLPALHAWVLRPLVLDRLVVPEGPVVGIIARLAPTGLALAALAAAGWLWLRWQWYQPLDGMLEQAAEEADEHEAAALGMIMDQYRVPLTREGLEQIRGAFEAARRGRLAARADR